MQPIQVLFISAQPLWAQACCRALETLPRKVSAHSVLLYERLTSDLLTALTLPLDVVIVCLDPAAPDLSLIPLLRILGCRAACMILCAADHPLRLADLDKAQVQSIVSFQVSFDAFVATLYTLVDGCTAPLGQQYSQTRCSPRRASRPDLLNARECAILGLVAIERGPCGTRVPNQSVGGRGLILKPWHW